MRRKIKIFLYSIKNGAGKILKIHALVFVIVFIDFLLFSCGLPSYPVLYPPIQEYTSEISFSHDPRNVRLPNFSVLGYDIIYRIYDSSNLSDSVDERKNKILEDMNSELTDSKLGFIISNNWNNMYPYRRLVVYIADGSTINTVPLIELDSTIQDNTNYTLSFGTTSDFPVVRINTFYTFSFARFIEDNNSPSFKNFNYSDFKYSDPDTPWNSEADKPAKLLIAFFAYTFGLTIDNYIPLHSDVVYIGYEEIE